MRGVEGLRRVDREIAAEKAAALGRAGERLELARSEAVDLLDRLAQAASADERQRLEEDYQRAARRAHDARLQLLIQREALGLRRQAVVDEQFPELPRIAPPRGPRSDPPTD